MSEQNEERWRYRNRRKRKTQEMHGILSGYASLVSKNKCIIRGKKTALKDRLSAAQEPRLSA